MAIAELADYTAYRSGSAKIMSDAEFPYYERQAERELNRQTFGRLASVVVVDSTASIIEDDVTYSLVLEDLKGCLCEIAEYLYSFETVFRSAQGGLISSYSNDGQSGSFNNAAITEASKTKEISGIAKKYLSGTILLKAGVPL